MKKNNKDKAEKVKKKDSSSELYGVAIIAFGILHIMSLLSNKMGIVGMIIKASTFVLTGFGGYFLPFIFIILGIILFLDKLDTIDSKKLYFLSSIFILFLVFLDGKAINNYNFLNKIKSSYILSLDRKGGGFIGAFIGYFFYKLFDKSGGYLVLFFSVIISLAMLFDLEFKKIIKKTYLNSHLKRKDKTREKSKLIKKDSRKNNTKIKETNIKISSYTENIEVVNNKKLPQGLIPTNNDDNIKASLPIKPITYIAPPLDILSAPDNIDSGDYKKEILNNAKIIEETMSNFGIEATITQINKGPTITCYELSPSPGIKLSKIVSLSDNIALSLASSDIRIEAPIPGKSAVGIEVPNKVKDSVYLKEILLSEEYINSDSIIPLSLGKDVTGRPIISSIDKMPHLLIAGATGSGKSVCINTIIINIIYKSSPDEVRLLLIDPKVVELSIYNSIPHLLIPVVTDSKKASSSLNWAVGEMERRYKLFAENSVRDIGSYNKKQEIDNLDKLSSIVIIIDELADLMMVAAQEIEDYISRLAQMARAAGIYLIVATQRPSVDVITGTIKANIPSRISFAVSSQIDSRTILDMGGAEKLLGKGDMLFYPSFYSKPLRIQGAFVSSDEVEKIVNHLKNTYESSYEEEVIDIVETNKNITLENQDVLLSDAIELVIVEGQASISLLQRRLRIGYARAARIIDEMESMEIISGYEGSKPRKVLITKEDLDTINI